MSDSNGRADLLFSSREIRHGIKMGEQKLFDLATATNAGKSQPVTFLGVLNGCYPFMVDFLRECYTLAAHAQICHVAVRDNTRVYTFSEDEMHGHLVIVLDDICDRGDTLASITGYMRRLVGPDGEVLSVVLCDRPERHPQFTPDVVCLTVPEDAGWLVGFGMDGYSGQGRYQEDIYHVPPRTKP